MASWIKGKRDEHSVAYYIYRTKMTINGVAIYAEDCGHRAFRRVRQIRNAAAHNNCIINDLNPTYDINGKLKWGEPLYITRFLQKAGINNHAMRKKLSNRRFSQIVHLLFAYNAIVTSSNSRNMRMQELKNLVGHRMIEHSDYFHSNQLLDSTYKLFAKLVNSLT